MTGPRGRAGRRRGHRGRGGGGTADQSRGARPGAEQGSGSILLAGVMGVVVLLACMAMVIAGYLLANHRARSAADLAALSGAAAFSAEEDACGGASSTARANGGRVLSCDVAGDEIDFVVSVRVAVPTPTRIPGLPKEVVAVAYAGPVGS